MKRILLSIALLSVSFFSFSQSHSKQEICNWLCSKLAKYATEYLVAKQVPDITRCSYSNCSIEIWAKLDNAYSDHVVIDLIRLSSFIIDETRLVIFGSVSHIALLDRDFLSEKKMMFTHTNSKDLIYM